MKFIYKWVERRCSRLECSPSLFIAAGVLFMLIMVFRFRSVVGPTAVITTAAVVALALVVGLVFSMRLIWVWSRNSNPAGAEAPAPAEVPATVTVASDDVAALAAEADALADTGLTLFGTTEGITTKSS